MKTRASAAASGVTPTGGQAQPNRSRAKDKVQIRDKTNNQLPPPPPPAPIKAKDSLKKPKRPKPKSKKQRITSKLVAAVASDAALIRHAEECTAYLHRWENNRSEWRFEKIKQIWLLKHALKRALINDEYFEVLLNYLTLLQGQAKAQTLQEMREHMQAYETKYLSVVQKAGTGDPTEEENSQYERARQIVQMLSEDAEEL